jgi:predicted dehydrogenase
MTQDNDVTRRDFVKVAGAATAVAATMGAPAIQKVRAANDQVQYGVIGSGSRGQYLMKHLKKTNSGRCIALCDIQPEQAKKGVAAIGSNPKVFTDYRDLLAMKEVEAVFVLTPLFKHYPLTCDALEAGKHVFCEKCLVFKPEEVHGLRAVAEAHPNQVLQTGLQRRSSYFYQTVKQMVDKGILGQVQHIHAQWHRNMINTPSGLWTMKPGGESNINNWRLYRSMSGGLTAELTSHQVDVADWMFGSTPDFVMGLGSLDILKDGRNVWDNIQLTYRYPKGQKLTYSSISTNSFSPYFNGQRTEMAECIMGTDGTIEITVGGDSPDKGTFQPPIAWWYPEPPKAAKAGDAKTKSPAAVAGATMMSAAGNVHPIPIMTADLELSKDSGFFQKEAKFARRWLMSKGIMVQEEQINPVDIELEKFFEGCHQKKTLVAGIEAGMNDSIAVILSNLAMDEERKVYYSEMDKLGLPGAKHT